MNLARALEPARPDTERHLFQLINREVLARVGLDFQAQRDRRNVLGIEPVNERHPSLALPAPRLAQPGIERLAQRIHHRTCWLGLRLDEVDILRIPGGRFQVKLVERGRATERERLPQHGVRENRDQRPADNEILLDLVVAHPGCLRPPFRNVVARNHRSVSTSAFT